MTTAAEEELIARLAHMNAETAKFVAEQRKLMAEERKFNRDPWFIVVTAFGAALAAILTKLL